MLVPYFTDPAISALLRAEQRWVVRGEAAVVLCAQRDEDARTDDEVLKDAAPIQGEAEELVSTHDD